MSSASEPPVVPPPHEPFQRSDPKRRPDHSQHKPDDDLLLHLDECQKDRLDLAQFDENLRLYLLTSLVFWGWGWAILAPPIQKEKAQNALIAEELLGEFADFACGDGERGAETVLIYEQDLLGHPYHS